MKIKWNKTRNKMPHKEKKEMEKWSKLSKKVLNKYKG